jgi:hypothetical protein
VALSLVHRTDARAIALRPSSPDGLRALAAAWRATQEPATGRPTARPLSPADPPASDAGDAAPPYWPDGPSAA